MKALTAALFFLSYGFAQAQQGPMKTPQINTTYYVGAVAGFYPTIQSAVTKACSTSMGTVNIPSGSAAGQNIASVTGGCTAVAIIDERAAAGFVNYAWNGSQYVAVPAQTAAGTNFDVQLNISGNFGVDTGKFTYNTSSHTLNWPALNGNQFGVDLYPGGVQAALNNSLNAGGIVQYSNVHQHPTASVTAPTTAYNGHTIAGYGKNVSDIVMLNFTPPNDFPFIDETPNVSTSFLTSFNYANQTYYGGLNNGGTQASCLNLATDTFYFFSVGFQQCSKSAINVVGDLSNGIFFDTDFETSGSHGFNYVGPTPLPGNNNAQGATDLKFFGGLMNFNQGYGIYLDNTGRDAHGMWLFDATHFETNGLGSYRFKWMDDVNTFSSYIFDYNAILDVGTRNGHFMFNETNNPPQDQGGMYNVAAYNSYTYALGGGVGNIDNAGPGALRNQFPRIEDYLDVSEVTDWDMSAFTTAAWTAGSGATIAKTNYTNATTGKPWLTITCSSSPCSASQTVTDQTTGSHWFRVMFQTGDQTGVTANLAQVVLSNSGGTLVDSGALPSWGGQFSRNDQSWETSFQSSTPTYTITLTCNTTAVPCMFGDVRDVQNYVNNPGFELGGTGSQPTSWAPSTGGTPCVVSTAFAHTGTSSMHCTGTSININQVPGFVAGDYYQISAWEYIPTGVVGSNAAAFFGYGDMHDGTNQNGLLTNNVARGRTIDLGSWQKVSFVIQDTVTHGIALGSQLAGINTYLDDVQVVRLHLNKQVAENDFNKIVLNGVADGCAQWTSQSIGSSGSPCVSTPRTMMWSGLPPYVSTTVGPADSSMPFATSITITELKLITVAAPAGCSTLPIFSMRDQTSNTDLVTLTAVNGTAAYSSGVISVPTVAGHVIGPYWSQAGVGCSTNLANTHFLMQYTQ